MPDKKPNGFEEPDLRASFRPQSMSVRFSDANNAYFDFPRNFTFVPDDHIVSTTELVRDISKPKMITGIQRPAFQKLDPVVLIDDDDIVMGESEYPTIESLMKSRARPINSSYQNGDQEERILDKRLAPSMTESIIVNKGKEELEFARQSAFTFRKQAE